MVGVDIDRPLSVKASTICILFMVGASLGWADDPTPDLATAGDTTASVAVDGLALDEVAAVDETAAEPIEAAPAAVDAPDPEAGRILGLIPDNKIVPSSRNQTEEPLTSREKWGLATKDTIDPYTFLLAGFYAGIAQWQDDYPSWRLGAEGYGRRFGAAYADQAVGNYLTEAIFPVLLREDPRYFRKGVGSGWSRMGYALTRVLITRTDRGRDEFNYSEFVGNGAAAGISNLYYPRSEATLGETGEKFAVQIVSDMAFNILLEFWPDMKRTVFRHTPLFH